MPLPTFSLCSQPFTAQRVTLYSIKKDIRCTTGDSPRLYNFYVITVFLLSNSKRKGTITIGRENNYVATTLPQMLTFAYNNGIITT